MSAAFIEVGGLTKRYGTRAVVEDVGFELESGTFLSLLGPSGSGKTTVLRMLAGLVRPDAGMIRIGGQEVFGTSRNVPVEERGLGMVFQDYALWPHMTVAQNVAFGLQLKRLPRSQVRQRVAQMLDLVGLAGMQQRFPFQLSGGQQQRVAMARALSVQPKLLLLDEPLASLDTGLREAMRDELIDIVRKAHMTVINVTHDQNEAMAMSDRVLVLRDGRVQQFGTPAELYRAPRSAFVGHFMGSANVIRGVLAGRADARVTLHQGAVEIQGCAASESSQTVGDAAVLLCRPEDVRVASGPVADTANVFTGTVSRVSFADGRWRLIVHTALADDILVYSEREITPATAVWLTLPADRCLLVAPEGA
jgi:ABC-type Fe3+/spermidine/putrescine transport system ATPase subunit